MIAGSGAISTEQDRGSALLDYALVTATHLALAHHGVDDVLKRLLREPRSCTGLGHSKKRTRDGDVRRLAAKQARETRAVYGRRGARLDAAQVGSDYRLDGECGERSRRF